MKRAFVIAVSAALFTTLFGGLATADPTSESTSAHADVFAQVDDGDRLDGSSTLKRCRRLFGEDELTAAAKEKCVQLWKRWCRAHPRARHCPRPQPPPPCRTADQAADHRCLPAPCLRTDQIVDRRCIPDPCQVLDTAGNRLCLPCLVTDRVVDRRCVPVPCPVSDQVLDRVCVPYPCANEDGAIVKCVPIPTDRPTDSPVVLPDRPAKRPTDKPADTRTDDRLLEHGVDRLTDRVGNDVHLRTVDADS